MSRMLRFKTGLSALALAGFMLAGAAEAYVSGGHEYDIACNEAGFILSSKDPVTRTKGSGAMTQNISGIEKIYLGKSCVAFHEVYGTGTWCWANGGFVADFADFSFGFARQELYCPTENDAPGLHCTC
jgi:hypothetical protein